MVKKSLIVIAVVALIAATAQAGDIFTKDKDVSYKEDGRWPYVYIPVEICKFPVYMEVGYFVTIEDCEKLEIVLEQVNCSGDNGIGKSSGDFPCYLGCEKFEARSNFDAIFGAELKKIGGVLDKTDIYFSEDDDNEIPGDGSWHDVEICIKAWKAKIYKAEPDDEVEVGEVTITVKPDSGY